MNHLRAATRRKHPRQSNNIFSDLLFLYTFKTFKKGFKRDLSEDDLYDVLPRFDSRTLGEHMETHWKKQKTKKSVLKLLWDCYGVTYLLIGLMQLVFKTALIVIQPYALGKLVSYFEPGQNSLTKQDAYLYAFLAIGLNFIGCIYNHNYYLLISALGIKIRQAFCAFLYRRALTLGPGSQVSIGQIITLITKDVNIFEQITEFGNEIWISLIKAVVICVILYVRVGLAGVVGVGFFFVIMPIQLYCGAVAKRLKLKMCAIIDGRLKITQEVLSAIRTIKMYSWEDFYRTKITDARKREVVASYSIFFLRYLVLVVGNLNSQVAFYLLLMTYIWTGNNVDAETVYYIITAFNTLSVDLSTSFPIGVYQCAELLASTNRIGSVLQEMEGGGPQVQSGDTGKGPSRISLRNLSVKVLNTTVLSNITFDIEDRGLVIVEGPVGSGKSVLLKTILGEFVASDGSFIDTRGQISYASQQPWLFPSTIRQNILFGSEYNEERYRQVVNNCALRYDLDQLPEGDNTIVEDRGINLSGGQQSRINLARAVYKNSDIYLLDDCLASLDSRVGDFVYNNCLLRLLGDKIVVLTTHNQFLSHYSMVLTMDSGKVVGTHKEPGGTAEECEVLVVNETRDKGAVVEEVYHESRRSGSVSRDVYAKYLKYGGGTLIFLLVVAIYATAQVVVSYSDNLISDWVNLEQDIANLTLYNDTRSNDKYQQSQTTLTIYGTLVGLTVLTHLGRCFALVVFTRAASVKLHEQMISSVMRARMEFFDRNFIGNILNRFSKDLLVIDEMIPFALHEVIRILLVLIGVIVLIATVNPIFLVPSALFLLVLVALRTCCLRTIRSLKRLEATTRSPIVGHFNATLEGLTTIRAFNTRSIVVEEFDNHQDLHTSASYMQMNMMRAFAFTIDLCCGLYIALIVLPFFLVDDDSLAGTVGLAITQAFLLNDNLQWAIRQWAEVENHMVSVERVLDYADNIEQEDFGGGTIDPSSGIVEFRDVSLRYNKNEVLKSVNFCTRSHERISIVGRTGAGKSSIISALLRLYDTEGTIAIDGEDIGRVSLSELRSRISVIPQDPVVFSGTVRDNVDPLRRMSDEGIWKVLRSVGLDQRMIQGLDFDVGEANFSVGQRQLLSLARALGQANRIVVLDEATANMDPVTESLVHQVISTKFRKCTVLTIAHKLDFVVKYSDRVMVVDKGEIREFDSPTRLLTDRNSYFYKMVERKLD